MALTTTTLSSAVLASDNSIVVASATGFAAGYMLRIDDEVCRIQQTYVSGTTIPLLRGQQGTSVVAHPSSANVVVGLVTDFDNAPNGIGNGTILPAQRSRRMVSYSASGAIDLPAMGEDLVAVLIGTSALAMTVAVPTKEMDGCILYIVGNGKSASTVTFASGLGNAGASYDVITLQNAGQVGFPVMACNGFWIALNAPITGTSTALSVGVA